MARQRLLRPSGFGLLVAVTLAMVVLMTLWVETASGEEAWLRWSDRALAQCTKLLKARKGRARLEVICENYQEVVEEEIRNLAINVLSPLTYHESSF
jgi:hypothetical protein